MFIIVFSLIIFQSGSPKPAYAGIFSFLEKIFKTDQVEVEKIQNSQTVALLEPVLNSSSGSAVGNIDITVINQNALLPDTGPMGTISDIGETMPLNDRVSIYIVRKGDNLSQIAKMFDVSVNTIIWANDLKNDGSLQIEQELIILPISGIQYTIQKGDTLKSIAQKFKSDADEIASFNDMNGPDSDLTIGETIIIPDG
ncbi:MAG: LysM peptidoglycan-binding domain-containing protein, partial [Patescibacteria group bacterium]